MSDWIPVQTRKQIRQARAEEHILAEKYAEEERIQAENQRILATGHIADCANLVNITTGLPNPVVMNWPAITKSSSYLLSERIGSTEGSALLKPSYLDSYTSFATLISNYTVPIYHIDYEEQTDMGYDHKGRRAPYVESITVSVWTFAGEKTPVVHVYDIDVDRYSKQKSSCRYKYSFSPVQSVLNTNDEYDEFNERECTTRMLSL